MATYNGHNEDASGNILLSIGNGMTATLETGTTASQAYTKGAYLYYNNRLCKVTAAIASGNTLTIGTNIAYTSLGAELTSHLKATNGDEFYFDYKDGEPGYYPSASKTASQFVPIGGTMSETLLWSNPSPTSSFAAQDVTLSQPITDFTYIKIVCRLSTSNSTQMAALFSPSDFGTVSAYPTKQPSITMTAASGSGGTVTRYSAKASSNDNSTIHFYPGSTTTTGSGSTKNGNTIPVAIYGLK